MTHNADVLREVPIHRVSAIDFDDAFSDGDDSRIPYKFSQDVVREELARNLSAIEKSWSEAEDLSAPSGFFEVQNTSISTLDVNNQEQLGHCDSPFKTTYSPSDSGMSTHFSQISLSASEPDGVFKEAQKSPSAEQPTGHVVDKPYFITDSSTWESTQYHPPIILELPENKRVTEATSIPTPSLSSTPSRETISLQTAPLPYSSEDLNDTPNASPLQTAPASTSTSLPAISSSPQPRPEPPQKPSGHRPTRSTGPSLFEKVRSKTRPSFLPPKPRQEDDRHLADWQAMMKHSRAAAEKRRKALQERRLARDKHIEDSIHVWEEEIVPDWRVVNRDPGLRGLWWGGIPTKLRATMWERAVGNGLALSKDHYRTCLTRAKRTFSSGVFPQSIIDLIEEDISGTLPAIHIFNRETGPLYGDLKDMLCAWVVARSDEGLGYVPGAAKIAAMLLINMPAEPGFVVMRNLLERHCMRSFFGGEGAKDDVEAYYRIFDTLLADGMPKIYFNFKQHQISPAAYLPDWILPLFLNHLPFESCARVWDVLLLEGDSFLYRAALAVLAVLEPRLFFPERKELLELLKGENKAALDVAKRKGQSLDGGKYEIYGVDEETLWERIDSMDEWWKESTWTRLLQRELPDL